MDSVVIYNGQVMHHMSMRDIDNLINFLRLDKKKMALEKIGVSYSENGLEIVELTYYEFATKKLKRCVIGINGVKINEYVTK